MGSGLQAGDTRDLSKEDPLKEEMATHSNILAGKSHGQKILKEPKQSWERRMELQESTCLTSGSTAKPQSSRQYDTVTETRNIDLMCENYVKEVFRDMNFKLVLWTECLCPHKFICWSPNIQCDGIWKWAFRGIIRFRLSHEGRTFLMGLKSL